MSERVTIVGDGAMATVCSLLLSQGGHDVTLWGVFEESINRLIQNRENQRLLPGVKLPRNVRLTANDAECFDGCTLILSAVPTQYMRNVWKRLARYVPVGVPIVSVAKGIENQTLFRPTQIIADVVGRGRGAGGACPDRTSLRSWRDICPQRPSRRRRMPSWHARIQDVFSTQWFRVYTNSDVIGTELAGATKNVIAIAAGILDGLAAGNNAKAALVTRGLVEITRLGMAMGAQESTFQGLAGLGDLITTCVSPEGRNRTVGEQSAKAASYRTFSAAWTASPRACRRRGAFASYRCDYSVEMPITEAVHAVLFEGMDVIRALTTLMTREAKAE